MAQLDSLRSRLILGRGQHNAIISKIRELGESAQAETKEMQAQNHPPLSSEERKTLSRSTRKATHTDGSVTTPPDYRLWSERR